MTEQPAVRGPGAPPSAAPAPGRGEPPSLADRARRRDQRRLERLREGRRRTIVSVLVALAANVLIAAAKLAGGLVTGSPALLSEAAHSLADSVNEVFLLTAVHRGGRGPSRQHPFGHGKERFFWSLLAAMGIFVSGGLYSCYEGVQAWSTAAGPEPPRTFAIALGVLGVALFAEGSSLARALYQARERRHGDGGRDPAPETRPGLGGTARRLRSLAALEDPALRTVVAEDGTAVAGVLIAAAGVGLHFATGDPRWEAGASLAIGVLLILVAWRLGRSAALELIGLAADPALEDAFRAFLEEQPEIDAVLEVLTMRLGPESVLLAASVDLSEGLDSEQVELDCMRIKTELRERWPQLDHVFLDITDAPTVRPETGPRPDSVRAAG